MDQITYEEIINSMKNKYSTVIGDLMYNNSLQEIYIRKYEAKIQELEQEIELLKSNNPTRKEGKQ